MWLLNWGISGLIVGSFTGCILYSVSIIKKHNVTILLVITMSTTDVNNTTVFLSLYCISYAILIKQFKLSQYKTDHR